MNRNCHLLQLPLHLIWKFTTDWSDIFFATARHTSHLAIKKYAAFALFWYGYTLLKACTGRFHYMGGTQYSGVAAGAFPPQVVWRGELSNIAWGETMERISSGMRGKTDAAPYWGCLPLFSPLWREEQSLQFPTSSKEIVAFIWLVITPRSGMRERGGGSLSSSSQRTVPFCTALPQFEEPRLPRKSGAWSVLLFPNGSSRRRMVTLVRDVSYRSLSPWKSLLIF